MRPPVLRAWSGGLIVDSFAGGGGASVGLERALGRSPDFAVNHDPEAIAMHAANHPGTRHLISNVKDVDVHRMCAGRPIEVLWLSPDCVYHSKARGGKPHRDRNRARRIRGLAWIAVQWARELGTRKPRVILLENVEEFADWGPLQEDGTPCPIRKGANFRRFVKQLQNLGYAVDWQELRACDYGAPTTRKRLFLVARADGQDIGWPEATHGHTREPYRTAAECIDWSIACPSIFDRKRLLVENTMRRIARGIWKYVIDCAEPFIVPVLHGPEARAWPIGEPMRTITAAHRGDRALVVPFIAKHYGDSGRPGLRGSSIAEPLHTITTYDHNALVVPTLINTRNGERKGQAPRVRDMLDPFPTVTATGSQGALVAAFLAKHYGGHETPGSAMPRPFDTITARDHHALVTSNLIRLRNNETAQDVREPIGTLTAGGKHYGEVRAFLCRYNGTSIGQSMREPISTIDTTDRFALVTIHGQQYAIVDIGMRMLEPHELFRAQGFPGDYVINRGADGAPLTKSAQVRMCGNSVSPPPAAALAGAQFPELVA